MILLNDIYYQPDYARLYVQPGESLFSFEYREGDAVFVNLAIKRPITQIGSKVCKKIWYDLETPYGYGGFYSTCDDPEFIEAALAAYRKRCEEERIIAEFIRFQPFNPFPVKNLGVFDLLIEDRDVVVIDLLQSAEKRWSQYGSTTRNTLRKCARKLTFEPSDNLEKFENLYAKTMARNDADDFYYFDRAYYEGLLALDGVRLYQVSVDAQVISMAFFMVGEGLAHYHLSANDPEYFKLNGNYFMLDQAFEEAKRQGAHSFMLGGGRSPDPEDSLLHFKKKFSRQTRSFYIAGLIHNQSVYNDYVAQWETQHPKSQIRYFLKYRLKEG